MSDDDIISFRISSLEDSRRDQLSVNKALIEGIAELKQLIVTTNARGCSKPNHCLLLDSDLQNHKLAFHERASRLEERLKEAEKWRDFFEGQLNDLKNLLNRGVGILSVITLIAAPLVVWGMGHFFPSK